LVELRQEMVNYQALLSEIFDSVAPSVGIQVLLLILERALWKTKIKYPDADKIKFNELGISTKDLSVLEAEKTANIINEFIFSIIETLNRLVGIQVAQKIARKFVLDSIAKDVG
jgi:hypothetical protein